MPLYVPTDGVSLLFGDRLSDERGCEIWWDINDPQLPDKLLACIREQGLPFVESVKGPADVVRAIERDPTLPTNLHGMEAVA